MSFMDVIITATTQFDANSYQSKNIKIILINPNFVGLITMGNISNFITSNSWRSWLSGL